MQHPLISGLTTTKSHFIEKAKESGKTFIHQPYELYDEENQETWRRLYAMLRPKWEKYANEKFMEGIRALCLNPNRIPMLEEINQFLKPLTGFQAKAVSGYVPSYLFFDSLRRREFPTTITIRDGQKLNYLPEPDIFHDIAGHVPMHTDCTFADVLVKFGSLASLASKRQETTQDPKTRLDKIKSNLRALSRFFWFTIEFGLMKQNNTLRVYGSGILSSADEIEHSIESTEVMRFPFQLEWIVNQSFEIDHFQPLLFIIDSFDHLYAEADRLEEWLMTGRLDHVAGGKPDVHDEDVKEFLK